jgi:hypothetical protein
MNSNIVTFEYSFGDNHINERISEAVRSRGGIEPLHTHRYWGEETKSLKVVGGPIVEEVIQSENVITVENIPEIRMAVALRRASCSQAIHLVT